MNRVYLNGGLIPIDEATISVNDRGFLFGDACYEATPYYSGRGLAVSRHLARLSEGLELLRIDQDVSRFEEIYEQLLHENQLDRVDFAMVYAHVTRGVAPRSHAIPSVPMDPTVYMFAKELQRMDRLNFEQGYSAITLDDERWGRPFIKTTNLLPNVLAQTQANESDCDDVIFHRGRSVTEGTHSNVFFVRSGELHTSIADSLILHGVTRQIVMELAAELGIKTRERPIDRDEIFQMDEIFFTGTTTEIRPTTSVDGKMIGTGKPGPVTKTLYRAFCDFAAIPSVID